MMLLIYTAQRPSGVLEMMKAQVIERDGCLLILLRQQKTAELVAIPLMSGWLRWFASAKRMMPGGYCWSRARPGALDPCAISPEPGMR
jgi:hypothetical protein